MWQVADTMKDFKQWTLFFDYFTESLSRDLARHQAGFVLPDGDEVFQKYFESIEASFNSK